MNPVDVSVIIPVYNAARHIHRCLNSVQAQRFSGQLEVILVDDGSTDDSVEKARTHPLPLRIVSQSNGGAASARNHGIVLSSARWLAFLDADDAWHPLKLQRCFDAASHLHEPGLIFTRYQRVRLPPDPLQSPTPNLHPSRHLYHPDLRKLIAQNFIGTSTVFVHRDAVRAAGGFPESDSLLRGQDYALWLRVASRSPLVYLPEILTHYGVHPDNRVGPSASHAARAGIHALLNYRTWCEDNDIAPRGIRRAIIRRIRDAIRPSIAVF